MLAAHKLALGTGAAMLAVALATAAAAQSPPAAPSPLQPAATPDEAVAETVSTAGATYAGDCSTTTSPASLGQVCATFMAQRGDLQAYLAGRTFAEFSVWVFVQRTAQGWIPLSVLPVAEDASPRDVPWPAA